MLKTASVRASLLTILIALVFGASTSLAQTGTITAEAVPSDTSPTNGSQITVDVNIDMSSVNPPDQNLGSFTGTLTFDNSVLQYNSDSGILAGFTGNVNLFTPQQINFNGANTNGVAGAFTVLTVTFDVVGAPCTPQTIDLEFSAMSAAVTFNDVRPLLYPPGPTDGSIEVFGYHVTIATDPTGLQITVEGVPHIAPFDTCVTPGDPISYETTSPQPVTAGQQAVFEDWDGDSNISQTQTPTGDITYTAYFMTQYQLTANANPPAGGSVSLDPAGGWYDVGTSVSVEALPNTGYQFWDWTGDLTGTTNPESITMDGPKSVTGNFRPEVNVTVDTNPTGLDVEIDGTTYTAPKTFVSVEGRTHDIGTPSPQGTLYWDNWSDAGAQYHSITVPAGGATYTANFSVRSVEVTIQTATPTDLDIVVDGTTYTAPQTFTWNANSDHTLDTPSPQDTWFWDNWSQGGAKSQTYTVPLTDVVTLTANFVQHSVSVTVTTDPEDQGLQVQVDGGPLQLAPYTFSTVENATHEISTPSPQGDWQYIQWDDAGAQTHNITVPAGGATYTASFARIPVQITIETVPTGKDFEWEGTPYTAPQTFDVGAGEDYVINAPSPQGTWFWDNWSDAGAQSHTYHVPTQSETVTATFVQHPVELTVAAVPGTEGLQLEVDETPHVAPYSWPTFENAQHTINAPDQPPWFWMNWDDSGAQSHTIIAPGTATTYTATFGNQPVDITIATTIPPDLTIELDATAHTAPYTTTLNEGSTHNLNAPSPQGKWFWSSWSDAGAQSHSFVVPSAPTTYTANFDTHAVDITITSVPEGLEIDVDGNVINTPQVFSWAERDNHVATAQTPQDMAGTRYAFNRWEAPPKAPDPVLNIVVPPDPTTYTAYFDVTHYQLSVSADPPEGGVITLDPAGDGGKNGGTVSGWYTPQTQVTVTATPNEGWLWVDYTGDIAGSDSQQVVTVTAPVTAVGHFIPLIPPVVAFCATPTMGCPHLNVEFKDVSEGDPTAWLWDFGDGVTSTQQNPEHTYKKPGKFDVTLEITTPVGKYQMTKENFIWVYGFGPICWAPLALVDNGPAHPGEGWDNAIDNDVSCWDGTVTAGGEQYQPAWAIFEFMDGTTRMIDKVRLMTDTGMDYEKRWVKEFTVKVSTTGIADDDFTTVLNKNKTGGDWEEFMFNPVSAKYIKLIIDRPEKGWKQIGEFQVCPTRTFASGPASSVSATSPQRANGVDVSTITIEVNSDDGKPIGGLKDEDFCVYATGVGNIYYPVEETATEGVYTTKLGALYDTDRIVSVSANGVLLGKANTSFTGVSLQTAMLKYVTGDGGISGEDWDNAIDGDEAGFDGTVTAGGAMPYGIFEFVDGSIKAIQRLRMLVDTGVGHPERWVKRFRVQVSTTGTADVDFTTVYDGVKNGGGWQEFVFPAANAKYVKLVLDHPSTGWRQIGEIEVQASEPLTVRYTSEAYSNLVSVVGVPERFAVGKNYPNPFNPETKINFALPDQRLVTIDIYNIFGQKVRRLLDAKVGAGYHTVIWNGKSDAQVPVSSGTYIFRLRAGSDISHVKMVLLR